MSLLTSESNPMYLIRTLILFILVSSAGFAYAQQIQWCQVRLDGAVGSCHATRDNCILFNKGSETMFTCVAIQKK